MAFRRRVGESDMLNTATAATVAAFIWTRLASTTWTHIAQFICVKRNTWLGCVYLEISPVYSQQFFIFFIHFVSFQEKLLFIAVATQQTCHMGMCYASVVCVCVRESIYVYIGCLWIFCGRYSAILSRIGSREWEERQTNTTPRRNCFILYSIFMGWVSVSVCATRTHTHLYGRANSSHVHEAWSCETCVCASLPKWIQTDDKKTIKYKGFSRWLKHPSHRNNQADSINLEIIFYFHITNKQPASWAIVHRKPRWRWSVNGKGYHGIKFSVYG